MTPRRRLRRDTPILRSLNDKIRRGRLNEVRDYLQKLVRRGIPATRRAEYANLAWRVGLADLGARTLSLVVRGGGRRKQLPSAVDRTEYAACLYRLGAFDEALGLLAGVDRHEYPEATLHEGCAHMWKWEYREAIPRLEAYLATPGLTPYEKMVARVNLASSLVYERRHVEATPLLRGLLHEASVKKLGFGVGVVLELSAGNFVLQKKFDEALPFLDRAERELASGGGDLIPFFIRKWKAIAVFLRDRGHDPAALDPVRAEAGRLGHWETIRDCDRFQAIATRDRSLATRLFFGTPYPSFRERLLRDLGPLDLPTEYAWDLGSVGDASAPSLRLASATLSGAAVPLKLGKTLHALLRALASDFYRPFRVASLYATVYEGAHFNPDTSPAQIHVLVQRLRRWLPEHALPLDVVEEGGSYRLRATGPVRLVVPRPDAVSGAPLPLARLRESCGGKRFTVVEAVAALGVSPRTAQRVLSEGEAQGVLKRMGRGRATHYAWIEAPAAKKR